jgi:hypothetical protein
MNIAEKPIASIIGRHTSTGDGIYMVANSYEKGVRLDTHMHREAQLVYAAKGTMQVTTPKGRWLVPPDRAVWVPSLSEHSIDVRARRAVTTSMRNSWCGSRRCCIRRYWRCSTIAATVSGRCCCCGSR